MVYVDLNPIRARLADRPEASDYTSIQERLGITPEPLADEDQRPGTSEEADKSFPQAPLMNFTNAIRQDSPANTLPHTLIDYLELVDWTGRAIREDKRGAIPADLPPLLARLNIEPSQWLKTATGIERHFSTAIGPVASLQQFCERIKQRWLHGMGACRVFYASPTQVT